MGPYRSSLVLMGAYWSKWVLMCPYVPFSVLQSSSADVLFFSNNARASYCELVISDEMQKTSNTNKGSKANSSEKIVQFSQSQLENLIETMISKATKPLEETIKKFELEAVQLRESQNFISK